MTAALIRNGVAVEPELVNTPAAIDRKDSGSVIDAVGLVAVAVAADPLLDVIAGVVSIPLHHVYALLWRADLLKIVD